MTRTTGVWMLLATLWLAGCGDSGGGGPGDTSGEPCVTGVVFECSGPGGCNGRRVCEGGFLGSCTCRVDAAVPTDGSAPSDGALGDGSTSPADAGHDATSAGDASDGTDAGTDDAATSDCACVAQAPSGWDGPVLVYEGAATAPACGGAYPDEVVEGGTSPSGDPANCSTCTCSGTGDCGMALEFESGGTDASCGGACVNSVSASCALLSPSCVVGQATTWLQTRPPSSAGTGCSPSAQSPSVPATSWAENARACAPDTALERSSCDTGELCAPDGPFAGALCVYKAGDVSCPGAGYTDRRVYSTGIADSRDCTACSCGVECDYTWHVYDVADSSCTSPIASLTAADQCVAVTPSSNSIRVGAEITSTTGPCTPSGGNPTGSVQGQSPVTVCCVP